MGPISRAKNGEKTCRKCREPKPRESFRRFPGGQFDPVCVTCRRPSVAAILGEWWQMNPMGTTREAIEATGASQESVDRIRRVLVAEGRLPPRPVNRYRRVGGLQREDGTRFCPSCETFQPLSRFRPRKQPTGRSYPYPYCLPCEFETVKRSTSWRRYIPALVERDGWACACCGEEMAAGDVSVDHFIPRSVGGPDWLANLRLVHRGCNSRKGNRMPDVLQNVNVVVIGDTVHVAFRDVIDEETFARAAVVAMDAARTGLRLVPMAYVP